MHELKFKIYGTHCKSCKMLIEDVLDDLNIEVSSFEIDEGKKESTLVIKSDLVPEKIIEAIQGEGDYKVDIIEE